MRVFAQPAMSTRAVPHTAGRGTRARRFWGNTAAQRNAAPDAGGSFLRCGRAGSARRRHRRSRFGVHKRATIPTDGIDSRLAFLFMRERLINLIEGVCKWSIAVPLRRAFWHG